MVDIHALCEKARTHGEVVPCNKLEEEDLRVFQACLTVMEQNFASGKYTMATPWVEVENDCALYLDQNIPDHGRSVEIGQKPVRVYTMVCFTWLRVQIFSIPRLLSAATFYANFPELHSRDPEENKKLHAYTEWAIKLVGDVQQNIPGPFEAKAKPRVRNSTIFSKVEVPR